MNEPTMEPAAESGWAKAALRLATLTGLILAFAFAPPTDEPLPPWLVILLCLGASRVPSLYEGLSAARDLELTLPFVAIALLGLGRFASGGLLALGAETCAAALLLASATGFVAALGSPTRWRLALASLPLLAALTFAWSLDRPFPVSSGELVLALLLATATRGRLRK